VTADEPPTISDEDAHAFDDACDDPECPQHGGGTEPLYGDEPPFNSRQVVVRVTPEMYEALWSDARANERTVSASVRWFLRRALGVPHA
jgi:hypothetical protein